MAQAKVVNITGEERHPDSLILATVANWSIARLEARLAWAQYDRESLYSTIDGSPDSPDEALDRMRQAQDHLAVWRPITSLGASALMGVVVDILQERQLDPDSVMSEGPAIEIAINIAQVLGAKDLKLKTTH